MESFEDSDRNRSMATCLYSVRLAIIPAFGMVDGRARGLVILVMTTHSGPVDTLIEQWFAHRLHTSASTLRRAGN